MKNKNKIIFVSLMIFLCVAGVSFSKDNTYPICYHYDINKVKWTSYNNGKTWHKADVYNETTSTNSYPICYHYDINKVKWVSYNNGITWNKAKIDIEKEDTVVSIDIFPNPAMNNITVSGLTELAANATLQIYGIDGDLYFSTGINGDLQKSIDISYLLSGHYYLTIISNDKVINQHFIVKK